jgi:hypothetical protein
VQNILSTLRAQGAPETTFQEAQAINRELALLLNRDISLKEKDAGPDLDVKAYVGNNYFLTDDLEVGFLVSGAYENQWRETVKLNRNFRFPDERTDEERESNLAVSMSSIANVGARYADDHEVVLTRDVSAQHRRRDRGPHVLQREPPALGGLRVPGRAHRVRGARDRGVSGARRASLGLQPPTS